MGFDEVVGVWIGKVIEFDLEGVFEFDVEVWVKDMCEKLFVNIVIESYCVELVV